MNTIKLISAWAEGIAAFHMALAQHHAGCLSPAAIDAATSRLERADRAVLALMVDAPLRQLQDDVVESLELAGTVLLLITVKATPGAIQAAQADLEEQFRIIDAEVIRQGLAPPAEW